MVEISGTHKMSVCLTTSANPALSPILSCAAAGSATGTGSSSIASSEPENEEPRKTTKDSRVPSFFQHMP